MFLDSVDPGVHTGRYCAQRKAWLTGVLEASRDLPVYLFLHHAPFPIELPHIDSYVMQDSEAFGELVAPYDKFRHIFFGHVHRPVSGSWRGIPFSALRGTNHQSWLDFAARGISVCSLEPPAYAVIFLDRQRTVVHFHDYLDASPKYAYDPAAEVEHQVRLLEM